MPNGMKLTLPFEMQDSWEDLGAPPARPFCRAPQLLRLAPQLCESSSRVRATGQQGSVHRAVRPGRSLLECSNFGAPIGQSHQLATADCTGCGTHYVKRLSPQRRRMHGIWRPTTLQPPRPAVSPVFRLCDPSAMTVMTTTRRNCVFCQHCGGISGRNSVRCEHFGGHSSPALESPCVFWSREPGADDEADPKFWRAIMERLYPETPDRMVRSGPGNTPVLTSDEIDRILRQVEHQRAAGLLPPPL